MNLEELEYIYYVGVELVHAIKHNFLYYPMLNMKLVNAVKESNDLDFIVHSLHDVLPYELIPNLFYIGNVWKKVYMRKMKASTSISRVELLVCAYHITSTPISRLLHPMSIPNSLVPPNHPLYVSGPLQSNLNFHHYDNPTSYSSVGIANNLPSRGLEEKDALKVSNDVLLAKAPVFPEDVENQDQNIELTKDSSLQGKNSDHLVKNSSVLKDSDFQVKDMSATKDSDFQVKNMSVTKDSDFHVKESVPAKETLQVKHTAQIVTKVDDLSEMNKETKTVIAGHEAVKGNGSPSRVDKVAAGQKMKELVAEKLDEVVKNTELNNNIVEKGAMKVGEVLMKIEKKDNQESNESVINFFSGQTLDGPSNVPKDKRATSALKAMLKVGTEVLENKVEKRNANVDIGKAKVERRVDIDPEIFDQFDEDFLLSLIEETNTRVIPPTVDCYFFTVQGKTASAVATVKNSILQKEKNLRARRKNVKEGSKKQQDDKKKSKQVGLKNLEKPESSNAVGDIKVGDIKVGDIKVGDNIIHVDGKADDMEKLRKSIAFYGFNNRSIDKLLKLNLSEIKIVMQKFHNLDGSKKVNISHWLHRACKLMYKNRNRQRNRKKPDNQIEDDTILALHGTVMNDIPPLDVLSDEDTEISSNQADNDIHPNSSHESKDSTVWAKPSPPFSTLASPQDGNNALHGQKINFKPWSNDPNWAFLQESPTI